MLARDVNLDVNMDLNLDVNLDVNLNLNLDLNPESKHARPTQRLHAKNDVAS
jgi:hypothetical protein